MQLRCKVYIIEENQLTKASFDLAAIFRLIYVIAVTSHCKECLQHEYLIGSRNYKKKCKDVMPKCNICRITEMES